MTGDAEGALRRYADAMQIGLGVRSLIEYLMLADALEGRAGVVRRIAALRARYPRHPVLEQVLSGSTAAAPE